MSGLYSKESKGTQPHEEERTEQLLAGPCWRHISFRVLTVRAQLAPRNIKPVLAELIDEGYRAVHNRLYIYFMYLGALIGIRDRDEIM